MWVPPSPGRPRRPSHGASSPHGVVMSTEVADRTQPPPAKSAAGRVLPGVLLAGTVGLSAHLAAKSVFPFALAVGLEVPLAMIIGLLLANMAGAADWARPGIRFAVKHLLGLGIVLLGLRLNLSRSP